MSSEYSRDQNAVAATGGAAERRAGGSRVASWLGGSRSSEAHIGVGHGVVWFSVIALVLAAWPVSRGLVFKSGSGFGYYIGIAGAVMMLLMLLYPVRKNMRWARGWGPLKYWFMLHMVFGICGPVLILFHSTFHVKSLNAGVALYSMLLVAGSGIIGRFIYTRIHHGLYGSKSDLKELQQSVDANQEKVSSVLMEAPGISGKLKQFHDMALAQEGAAPVRAWRFAALGWRRHSLEIHCHKVLRSAVVLLAKSQGWDQRQQDQHWQTVALQVSEYLAAVQQAAQYTTYERLMRLWHVLHTPFVWLLAISGIVHVIAVNMY
ncbi:MAG: hypothetical protein A2V79_01040 [Betaproteobacteria bacterium RBG_16_56_24]|nr:MAG: hypothetical protein A2V79_01040 [Betaproteobacteria bacterium RBG_16_56_24]